MANSTLTYLALFSLVYTWSPILVLAHRGKARHASGLTEFFVSGRDLGLGTAIATLGATEIGLITIAYNAQKGFNEGFLRVSHRARRPGGLCYSWEPLGLSSSRSAAPGY